MSKHHETAPIDPINAATAKYGPGMPVPGLTAASPDEVLVAHLQRGNPIGPIAAEIEPVYMRARLQFGAPVAILDAKQVEFRDRNRTLMQSVPAKSFDTSQRNAAEWHRDIAVLRSCLEYREWLTTFLARWANLDGTARAAELAQFESDTRSKAYVASAGANMIQSPPDWRKFVADLALGGIIVTAAGDGNLTVTNADRLGPAVRARLVANKAAILASMGAVETI